MLLINTLEQHLSSQMQGYPMLPSNSPTPRSIMVVEDEPTVRLVLRLILEREGFRVLDAEDGPMAIRLAENEPALDLLLTDIMLPDMTGPSLAAYLRTRHPGLKVAFISGYSSDWARSHGVDPERDLFLLKPIMPRILVDAVRTHLALN